MDFPQYPPVHDPRGDWIDALSDTLDMDHDEPNHLRAWRKMRKLTQQQLADKCEPPTSKSVIAALENGDMGLTAKWLRKLAPALGTTPGFLLDHDPGDLDRTLLEAAVDVPQERRQEAVDLLKVISGRR